ncbi:hypothetical protein OVA24_01410 [Luteolibacter sp. SL250]|uniref:hypothetical protein n=1 Tax=Luteolibacter sp. SL250 TaxID=2995170 RepID=UPI00226F650D|nr:hypothetical protein [Luteolibacter sp. SL250]WAC20035.1 hypothetical protein OVA24_01410 [Luteolibacter sp. SL250]
MKEADGTGQFREIELMAPARAYRAVSFIRELARVVCFFGSHAGGVDVHPVLLS